MINETLLLGNLTRDPELRYVASGSAVCNFGVAINRRYKQDGQEKEETTFVDLVSWAKTAELVSALRKGQRVMVKGRLKTETWTDKQTQQPRSKLTVVAEMVIPLQRLDDPAGQQKAPPASSASHGPAAEASGGRADDVPF